VTRTGVWVIGGYLGAGKTTLLNALLRAAGGIRYGVLVNDFGSVNVDATLIAQTGTDAVELTNGCTCCTIGGDLALALKALMEREPRPGRIVIEASGVADPQAVARIAACHPELDVKGAVVVVDAETILERIDDKYVGGLVRRQIGAAGTIVLSKVDLVDGQRLADVRAWLMQTYTGIPVLESGGDGCAVEAAFDPAFSATMSAETAVAGDGGHPSFVTETFRATAPLDRVRFAEAADALLPVVARAKGTVSFAGDPATRYIFQLSGQRWCLEPLDVPDESQETQIVAIAIAPRRAALAAAVALLRRAETVSPAG